VSGSPLRASLAYSDQPPPACVQEPDGQRTPGVGHHLSGFEPKDQIAASWRKLSRRSEGGRFRIVRNGPEMRPLLSLSSDATHFNPATASVVKELEENGHELIPLSEWTDVELRSQFTRECFREAKVKLPCGAFFCGIS